MTDNEDALFSADPYAQPTQAANPRATQGTQAYGAQSTPLVNPYAQGAQAANPYAQGQQAANPYAQTQQTANPYTAGSTQRRGYTPPASNPYISGPTSGAMGVTPERVRSQPARGRFKTNETWGLSPNGALCG